MGCCFNKKQEEEDFFILPHSDEKEIMTDNYLFWSNSSKNIYMFIPIPEDGIVF